MAAPTALDLGASLRLWMDALLVLEAEINNQLPDGLRSLSIERWRPNTIDPPALYHLVGAGPTELRDVRVRDNLTLYARIAMPFGDSASEMDELEQYIDIFRQVVDPALMESSHPLGGAAVWADRTDMRLPVPEEFNGIPYQAVDFTLSVRLERFIVAT